MMPPPEFFVTNGVIDPPKKVTAEEVLTHYIEANNSRLTQLETDVSAMVRQMVNHEKLTMQIQTQLTQITHQIGVNFQIIQL